MFKVLAKDRFSRKRPWTDVSRENLSVLMGIDPRHRKIGLDRLALLREFQFRLSKPRKPKTKGKVIRDFLREVNSGILWPNASRSSIRHLGISTLYGWLKIYKKDRLAGLVPKYKTKLSKKAQATFLPLARPIELKFPGRPKRNGKAFFLERLRRRWERDPLEQPIKLTIFYSMAIPKGTKMQKRTRMLKHRISHTSKPYLSALDRFIVSCLSGVVFKDQSQIIQFHSQKDYEWWPQIRILIRALSG